MSAISVINKHSELIDVNTNYSHIEIDEKLNILKDENVLLISQSAFYENAKILVPGTGLIADIQQNVLQLSVNETEVVCQDNHKTLKHLIHFINDGPGDGFFSSTFKETSGIPFIDRITWWDSSLKQNRIFQTEFTRSLNKTTTTRSYKMYDTDGFTILSKATDVITFVSGIFEQSRTRTFT